MIKILFYSFLIERFYYEGMNSPIHIVRVRTSLKAYNLLAPDVHWSLSLAPDVHWNVSLAPPPPMYTGVCL